jgi:hypothetical protein
METFEARPLFGGACSIEMPERFTDVSDFRPIPSHQEVMLLALMPMFHNVLAPYHISHTLYAESCTCSWSGCHASLGR